MRSFDQMSAFYPGAGTDLVPPSLFPEINTWFYMDRLPGCCCSRFLHRLDRVMDQAGFTLESIDGNRRIYRSAMQTIYYDTNSTFPDQWDPLLYANMRYNTLVLCGYDLPIDSLPPGFFSSYAHIITTDPSAPWRDHLYHSHTISKIMQGTVEKNIRCTHPVYTCRDHLGTPTLKKLFKLRRREALVNDST